MSVKKRLEHLTTDHVVYLDVDPSKGVAKKDRCLVVRERESTGHAIVRVPVPHSKRGISLPLSDPSCIGILKSKVNADGHLLLQVCDDQWDAHVIECKRTLSYKKLEESVHQIRAGFARLEMVAALLGVNIVRRHAWIATRRDEVSAAGSTNPRAPRVEPVGTEVFDWKRRHLSGVNLGCPDPDFGVIELDERGEVDCHLVR